MSTGELLPPSLLALLREPGVTDVLINAGPVWVDRGGGLEPAGLSFAEGDLRVLAHRLATRGGHRLDDAHPYADIRLPGGIRLHAITPPLAPDGVHLSFRVPASDGFDLAELVRRGAIPPAGEQVLRRLVASGTSYLVGGGTGSGKTTVLSALLSLVPGRARIVVVEDFPELRPEHPHVVRLTARPPNAEGAGEIGVGELIRQALRMRPDRLVVGEARGGEITDLLTALNTGHTGGCGTIHVERPDQVPARVEALAAQRGWPPEATRRQLVAAVQAVVQLARRGGHRVITGISRLRLEGDRVAVVPAWRFDDDGVSQGPAAEGVFR